MKLNEIHNKIENARALDFGDVLSECIELFKKVWLQGLLTVLIIMLITVPFAMISAFVLELLGIATQNMLDTTDFSFETITAFYGVNALYNIPLSILSTFVQIALLGGFYRICKQKDFGESINDDYFYFFKQEYLTKILMLALIHTAIATVAQMLCFVPYLYVIVPLMYFTIMFAFNSEKSVEEIMKTSFLIGNKKWLISFGTLFVCGILGMLGVIGCGIGLLFTVSIVYLPCYVIYKHVVGFEENSEILKIGTE
ncbi:hypothetical protein [Lacinutrix salivirga]